MRHSPVLAEHPRRCSSARMQHVHNLGNHPSLSGPGRMKSTGWMFEFTCVIGPDEYHDQVDNNAFTNYSVSWLLLTAFQFSDVLMLKFLLPDRFVIARAFSRQNLLRTFSCWLQNTWACWRRNAWWWKMPQQALRLPRQLAWLTVGLGPVERVGERPISSYPVWRGSG
jgi:hypothetical protein